MSVCFYITAVCITFEDSSQSMKCLLKHYSQSMKCLCKHSIQSMKCLCKHSCQSMKCLCKHFSQSMKCFCKHSSQSMKCLNQNINTEVANCHLVKCLISCENIEGLLMIKDNFTVQT